MKQEPVTSDMVVLTRKTQSGSGPLGVESRPSSHLTAGSAPG